MNKSPRLNIFNVCADYFTTTLTVVPPTRTM